MDWNASTTYFPVEQAFVPENFTYGNVTAPHYFPYPRELRQISDGEKTGKILAYLVIFVTAIVGNCLVIYTVAVNKKMRTTTNFYLTNLAVADILIAMCCMWVALIKDLTDPVWIFGDFMCRFNTFMQGQFIRENQSNPRSRVSRHHLTMRRHNAYMKGNGK
ncbi:hypothetical protein Bbelb_010380 [Branchiostoma belcheri]|nr:hypothetical protein Bbelb_010380 [Branchiostoma belcheri]